jgi:hypothetical protein
MFVALRAKNLSFKGKQMKIIAHKKIDGVTIYHFESGHTMVVTDNGQFDCLTRTGREVSVAVWTKMIKEQSRYNQIVSSRAWAQV